MASVASLDSPVYTISDLPRQTRHVVLTPAMRWRVVIEKVEAVEYDVMLETVLRIRAAGERSPHAIADRLQLPEELVRHLLAQSSTGKLAVTPDRKVVSSTTTVAWAYRDLATGELWSETGDEMPPVPVRFTSPHRGRFDMGTAGRPVTVQCLLLDSPERAAAEPTSVELTQFRRGSTGRDRRTAVVGSGEPCLVASPVSNLGAGSVIETTNGLPHLSLTQHLARMRARHTAIAEWLDRVPAAVATPTARTPLASAIDELRSALDDFTSRRSEHDTDLIVGRTVFCLSRAYDHHQYFHRHAAPVEPMPTPLPVVADRLGLDHASASTLAQAADGTPARMVARLLTTSIVEDARLRRALLAAANAAASWEQRTVESLVDSSAIHLAEIAIDLGDRLLSELEHPRVEPTE